MAEEETYKIVPYKDRFIIIDLEGVIIEDARGYGFKTFESAKKAALYKFGGGKEKISVCKAKYNDWAKENKKVVTEIDNWVACCFKEISRGETTMDEIFKRAEEELSIKIPGFVKNYLRN